MYDRHYGFRNTVIYTNSESPRIENKTAKGEDERGEQMAVKTWHLNPPLPPRWLQGEQGNYYVHAVPSKYLPQPQKSKTKQNKKL